MPRIAELQPSFNAGELSPRLAARLDFVKYRAGVETSENLIPLSEGGLMRRSGSRYVAELKSSSVKGRLKRFRFSTTQAYILEMGNLAMRFYRHQGQIVVATTDAAITNGTFTANIAGWDDRSTGGGSIAHDATNGRLSLIPGGTAGTDIGWAGQTETTTSTNVEHVIKFRVLGAPGDKIEFQVGTTITGTEILSAVEKEVGYHCVAFTPTASPFYIQFRNLGSFRNKTVQIDDVSIISNDAVEIDTPWLESELFNVTGPQSADILYLFHDSHPTYKLLRLGNTTWSLVEVGWQDGPYLDENVTATTLLPSANTGIGITLTLSSTTGVNDDQGWLSTDVGRLVRYKKTTTWGWAIITSITSTTIAVADVRQDFEATPTAVTTWRVGSWSETDGYPQTAGFFEQRLYIAATDNLPQTFWASQTADFENFKPDNDAGTIEADDALNFTLSADDVNAIYWISSGENTLSIGTEGGVWLPQASGVVITPLDITVRRQPTTGSARIQPTRIGSVVLFPQRAKHRIQELVYSFENNGFVARDLTRLASHITHQSEDTGGIIEMDFAQESESILWVVRNDGQLLSMTFRRDEDVVGWSRHILGGSFQGLDSVVESVATIPGANGSGQTKDSTKRDEVWVIVKRTINGATKRYIEFFERDFDVGDSQEDAYYSDSLITLDNPTTISGATKANPVVLTITAHGYANGDVIRVTDVKGMTELNGNSYTVANKTTNTVELTSPDDASNINGTAFTTYISGGKANLKVTAISGLGHLEGETVKIWADGAIQADKTVASSQITLDNAASVVQIGLGYTHKVKTLKISSGNPAGTALGKTKRIYGLTFALLNSHTLKFGPDESNLITKDFRIVANPMDSAAPLFTGEQFIEFSGDWATDGRIIIEGDDPAPFTVLALAPEFNLNPLR